MCHLISSRPPDVLRLNGRLSPTRGSRGQGPSCSPVAVLAGGGGGSRSSPPSGGPPPPKPRGRPLHIGFFPAVTAPSAKVDILARGEFYRPQLLAHPPAGDHSPRKVGGLLYVVFGPCSPCTVDDLLRAASS